MTGRPTGGPIRSAPVVALGGGPAEMSMAQLAPEPLRERAVRQQDSLEITPGWRPSDDAVFLLMFDQGDAGPTTRH